MNLSNKKSYHNESEDDKKPVNLTSLKSYSCKKCGNVLRSSGALYNHELKHKGIKRNMCGFCGKLFLSSGQLKIHERKHTHDKPFICHVCNKSFGHRQSLITHSTIHTGVRPFVCENCKNSFSCIGNLLKHRRTHLKTCGQIALNNHTVNNPDTYTKIKLNTPITSKLKGAKILQHKKISFKCDYHVQFVDGCDICDIHNGITEECRMLDKTHMQQNTDNDKETTLNEFSPLENEDNKQTIKCLNGPVYNEEFHSKNAQHFVSTSNAVGRIFSCKTCGKKCKWKGQLKIHERSHTGEKPFTCLYCPKAFAYRESLLTHSTLHTGVKPHICEICGARFSCVGNLNKHKNRHNKQQTYKSKNEVDGI